MVAREPLRQHSKPRQARRGARSGKAPDLCAALVAELLIASPKNRTREGSMLPSVCEHRAEGHRSRADSWSETQSSDVALEMELEDIARLRERLGAAADASWRGLAESLQVTPSPLRRCWLSRFDLCERIVRRRSKDGRKGQSRRQIQIPYGLGEASYLHCPPGRSASRPERQLTVSDEEPFLSGRS
ncbi:hypothetical protein AK812_SmicGene28084 [Symbiodinium microadriaticum]|uniref:Uncharacterized protein n=1 Tax=Symbiodinium microadriaticum TaxID=2951 RepID=A0A1Q9D564_SYMMI|nr:hypothetical protein AK812_SmicGene28084 [Symbiodinium microadriaticum]